VAASGLELIALPGIPEIRPGYDLCSIILAGLAEAQETIRAGDILVVAQKIVSKAEARYVDLADVAPSAAAIALAKVAEKDPRLVQLVLDNSQAILRLRPGLIIAEHQLGMVMANAGIDFSNLEANGQERALLLPRDPDATCAALRTRLRQTYDCDFAVIINDTWGRAWRRGVVGQAIGVCGLPAVRDLRGTADRSGRPLTSTDVGFADEIAAAASLLQGQSDEGIPVVLLRGFAPFLETGSGRDLIREREKDLFR
jgi:coenzyme F420-0:L-glutamate ligase / coenzyme F420-1:gamma-L-glutamate ligase